MVDEETRKRQQKEAYDKAIEAGIPEAVIERFADVMRARGFPRYVRLMAALTIREMVLDIEDVGGKITWNV